MKLDRSGIEKVNWGGFFRNLFCKVRKVPSNPVENAQIRQALLMAIGNSSEGKVLTEDQMQQIYSAIGVTADEAGENAFLFGEVPAPPPDREEAFRKAILEANFFGRETGGAVFSINPDTGAYTLVRAERLDRLDPKSFFALVEGFVNVLATWKGIADAVQDVDVAPPPDGVTSAFAPPGFMQV
jgi:hypothetical protein